MYTSGDDVYSLFKISKTIDSIIGWVFFVGIRVRAFKVNSRMMNFYEFFWYLEIFLIIKIQFEMLMRRIWTSCP